MSLRKQPLYLLDKRFKSALNKNTHLSWKDITFLLQNSVIEISFVRRNIPKDAGLPGHKYMTRHMLCTANWAFINQYDKVVGFKPPKGKKGPTGKKIKIVWDLLKKDWRIVTFDKYYINAAWVLNTDAKEWKDFITDYYTRMKKYRQRTIDKFSDA